MVKEDNMFVTFRKFVDEKLPQYHIPSLAIGFLVGLACCWIMIDSFGGSCLPTGMCMYMTRETNITYNCKEGPPTLDMTLKQNLTTLLNESYNQVHIELANNTEKLYTLYTKEDCPPCSQPCVYNELTTTTQTTSSSTTSTVTTTTQTKQPIGCDTQTKQQLQDMRWKNPGGDCLQKGYQIGKTDCLAIVGIAKTYDGQPVYDNSADYYKGIGEITYNDSVYVFVKQSGSDYGLTGLAHNSGFPLNHSIWNWTTYNLSWSVDNWTNWTDADNLTWQKNTPYMIQNDSGNLWIQRL
jgi:hypothetical protein